jgi:hypothetical protein
MSSFQVSSSFNNTQTQIVNEWLLFNANSAIFQLYHGEKKLIFDEMTKIALF